MSEHIPPSGDFPANETDPRSLLRAQRRPLLLLAAITGLGFAALFSRTKGLGINAPLMALIVSVCYLCAAKKFRPEYWRGAIPYTAGAILLALSVSMTANEFVQIISILGILILLFVMILTCFAQTSSRQFGRFILAAFLLVFSALRKLPEPVMLLFRTRSVDTGKALRVKHVIIGLLISIPIVWIVFSLLLSADAVFYRLMKKLLVWNLPEFIGTFRSAVLLFLLSAFGFYCALAGQLDHPVGDGLKRPRRGEPLIAITLCCALTLIYAVFCAIQIIYLFSGGQSALPEGLTYSGYARQGFFQLLFVSLLNVALVIICSAGFNRHRALDILLNVISGCTYILIASSAYRMQLYVDAYGLTFLRLFVFWFLAVLTLIMTGTIVFIWKRRFPLFHFSLFICLAMWLCFSFAKPDRIAAQYNSDRFGLTEDIAHSMLCELSMDAVPVMAQYEYKDIPELYRKEWLAYMQHDVPAKYDRYGVRAFNFSLREAARAARSTMSPPA